ncbi:unnamed protein product, partial [Chrysoparadoxa australica]
MARRFLTALTASVASIALSGCLIVDVETRERAPAATASPAAATYSPGSFNGPGADWRTLAESELADRLNRPRREGRARNVILFVADGMNVSTITAARILDGQNRGNPGEENYLPFETWGHSALIKTYNENAQVPDSAGTATALHTGVKTDIGAISTYAGQGVAACGDAAEVPATTLERAHARGMSTGLVTTTRLTHATPASAYAHLPSRDWESDTALPPF